MSGHLSGISENYFELLATTCNMNWNCGLIWDLSLSRTIKIILHYITLVPSCNFLCSCTLALLQLLVLLLLVLWHSLEPPCALAPFYSLEPFCTLAPSCTFTPWRKRTRVASWKFHSLIFFFALHSGYFCLSFTVESYCPRSFRKWKLENLLAQGEILFVWMDGFACTTMLWKTRKHSSRMRTAHLLTRKVSLHSTPLHGTLPPSWHPFSWNLPSQHRPSWHPLTEPSVIEPPFTESPFMVLPFTAHPLSQHTLNTCWKYWYPPGQHPLPLWTEWPTGVKTLPSRNLVCGR